MAIFVFQKDILHMRVNNNNSTKYCKKKKQ